MKPRICRVQAGKFGLVALTLAVLFALSGCSVLGHAFCAPNCDSQSHSSSSLVTFLYPDGKAPPPEDSIPELRVPLRVGLAFLPSQSSNDVTLLPAASREELMDRIRKRFSDRKFVSEIVLIPDYYLKNARGYEGLQGVQRLYNVDVMALVSYDQVARMDDNGWSLGYMTIVGAYVLKGSRHDVATLIDLAVIDPSSRSLILRAGGTDTRHGNTTLIEQRRETRSASAEGFSAATNSVIENFDLALTRFEADVKEGKARVKVVKRSSPRLAGGGGAMKWYWLLALASLPIARSLQPRKMK